MAIALACQSVPLDDLTKVREVCVILAELPTFPAERAALAWVPIQARRTLGSASRVEFALSPHLLASRRFARASVHEAAPPVFAPHVTGFAAAVHWALACAPSAWLAFLGQPTAERRNYQVKKNKKQKTIDKRQ